MVVRGDVGDEALDPCLEGARPRGGEQGPADSATLGRVDDLEGDLGRHVVLAQPAPDANGRAALLGDERDVPTRCHVAEMAQHAWGEVWQPGVIPGHPRAEGQAVHDHGERLVVTGGQGPDAEVASAERGVRRHSPTVRGSPAADLSVTCQALPRGGISGLARFAGLPLGAGHDLRKALGAQQHPRREDPTHHRAGNPR